METIQGKTLEQVAKNVSSIVTADLVSFYNEFSGKKAIKKFTDRATAETRVSDLVGSLLMKKAEGEVKAKKNGSSAPQAPAVSKAGWTALEMIRQCLKDWEDTALTSNDLSSELGQAEAVTQKTMDVLERDGFLIKVTINNDDGAVPGYSRSGLGKSARQPGKSAGKTGTATAQRGQTGPKSELDGQRIYIHVDGNPCREGSVRAKHFSLVKDGMLYEEYRAAGGNAFNLNDGILRGFFTMQDGDAKAPATKKMTVEVAVENARTRIAAQK